jgi:hypothetical protein
MQRKILLVSLVILLLSLEGLSAEIAAANPFVPPSPLPKLLINSVGTVETPTSDLLNYINRTGNTYTLTADMVDKCQIVIECSNIVLDGAGHTKTVTTGSYQNIIVLGANVTVKNLEAQSFQPIRVDGNNCLLTDVVTNGIVKVNGEFNTVTKFKGGLDIAGNNNLILKSSISELYVVGQRNSFCLNNFELNPAPMLWYGNSWDNGTLGNYWSAYQTKYPNAIEVGQTGIGNIPYLIERDEYSTREYPNARNVDNFPLLYPVGTSEVTVFDLENASYVGSFPLNFSVNKQTQKISYSLDQADKVTVVGNVTLNDLPAGNHSLTVFTTDIYGVSGASKIVNFTIVKPEWPPQPESFPVVPVVAVSIVAVALVAAGLLVYHKKHKHNSVKKP